MLVSLSSILSRKRERKQMNRYANYFFKGSIKCR